MHARVTGGESDHESDLEGRSLRRASDRRLGSGRAWGLGWRFVAYEAGLGRYRHGGASAAERTPLAGRRGARRVIAGARSESSREHRACCGWWGRGGDLPRRPLGPRKAARRAGPWTPAATGVGLSFQFGETKARAGRASAQAASVSGLPAAASSH
jgi:hypothetical protein